jgi:hypothetical protein
VIANSGQKPTLIGSFAAKLSMQAGLVEVQKQISRDQLARRNGTASSVGIAWLPWFG